MSGFRILSETERREMLEDALAPRRRDAFRAARQATQRMTLEEYLGFLSEHVGLVSFRPRTSITDDFRL